MEKEILIEHYNKKAKEKELSRKRNRYYWNCLLRYYKFYIQIQEKTSILELGCGDGFLLSSLKPKRGVGVDIAPEMIKIAKEKYKNMEFYCQDVEEFDIDEKFDYIIISQTLSEINDIQRFLERIKSLCSSSTRIIIDSYNPLWEPILKLAEKLKLKMEEKTHNWLSTEDIENFLLMTGYEVVKKDFFLLFPKYIPLISSFINKIIAKIPVIRRMCLIQFLIARLNIPPENADKLTTSVVITVRNEKENIEGLVKRIPNMGAHTEIIFVEGHSTDGTREEIQRVIEKYNDKDIKLFVQDKIGQKDAFRKGFDNANSDFILWLEGDLTTPPEELSKFWEVYISGRGEYLNGTRLIYRMEKNAMPFINLLGNRFFGNIFTIILGERFTDTLCGLKGISKKNYLKIRDNIDFFGDFDPFGDFELIFGVCKSALKIVEIPVKYIPRQYGKTKTKPFKHGWFLLKMSWIGFLKFKLL